MANVYNVTTSNTSNEPRAYQETNKSALDKNAFMKILMAQLSHQDPMEPMKDNDFIAQMAQFSSLENMQAMSGSMIMNNAYSMIGKFVSFIEPDTGKEIAGSVQSVFSVSGEPRLQVGDYVLKMEAVISVYDPSVFEKATTNEDILKALEALRKAITGEKDPADPVDPPDTDDDKTTGPVDKTDTDENGR